MRLVLARSRITFLGQASIQRSRLGTHDLNRLGEIVRLVVELPLDTLSIAAKSGAISQLSETYCFTAASPSEHLPKIHFSVFSSTIVVRFEVSKNCESIVVVDIETGCGPTGGGNKMTTPSSRRVGFSTRILQQLTLQKDGERRLVAFMPTLGIQRQPATLGGNYGRLDENRGLIKEVPTSGALSSAIACSTSFAVSRCSGPLKVLAEFRRILSLERVVHLFRASFGNRQAVRDCLSETLVQSTNYENAQVALKNRFSSIVKQALVSDIHTQLRVFYFGPECVSAQDRDILALVVQNENRAAKIYLYSDQSALVQRNSVDLILAAALSASRDFGASSVSIQCDGHIPFSESGGLDPTRALPVWRHVFKTKRVCSDICLDVRTAPPSFEFILNPSAQEAVADYYKIACKRFALGMARNDVYVWKELAFWLRSNRYSPELSIVVREVCE
jgi:hypothetical protein